MNFTQFSESRKSTRGFQEKPVPKEDAAPSGTTCKVNHRVVMDVPERGKYASSEAYSSEYSLPVVKYRTNKRPAHLKCSRLEHGFLRLRCATCRLARLVAISWTQRLKRVFNIDRGLRSLQRIGNGFSAGPLDNLVAGNVAHTRSGMSGYELHEHRRTSFSGQ